MQLASRDAWIMLPSEVLQLGMSYPIGMHVHIYWLFQCRIESIIVHFPVSTTRYCISYMPCSQQCDQDAEYLITFSLQACTFSSM